ncbi:cation transporter [Hirschia baltica]|uniref:Cation efflux protein n=1 Tax=Hirschia baltica (strain ATCC 49814 / DSM 5838 / IFAM 1418) TaxID=582402 RepID=C6XPD0_HIRBI|nr:cation transporter [Hirschia baltica]ACT58416.1 cation efflux protein [Hirschia baltica ATCC 49814]
MSDCCDNKCFDGVSEGYKRALIAVIFINAIMFVVEMYAGLVSGSQSLKADALDFAGDTATYALSLAVIGASVVTRARASLFKGATLALIAISVLIMTVFRVFSGAPPQADTMGLIGFAALLANLTSVAILIKWRDGDSNVRSVWLCSRNDAIGNVAVILAAFAVAYTNTAWPDLIVAVILASLFLKSATSISLQALQELNTDRQSRDLSKRKVQ